MQLRDKHVPVLQNKLSIFTISDWYLIFCQSSHFVAYMNYHLMPRYLVFVPSVQIYQNLVVGRTVNLGMGFVFQTTGGSYFTTASFLKNDVEIKIAQIKSKIPI